MILVLSLWVDHFIISLPHSRTWEEKEKLGDSGQTSPLSLFCSTLLESKVCVLGRKGNLSIKYKVEFFKTNSQLKWDCFNKWKIYRYIYNHTEISFKEPLPQPLMGTWQKTLGNSNWQVNFYFNQTNHIISFDCHIMNAGFNIIPFYCQEILGSEKLSLIISAQIDI